MLPQHFLTTLFAPKSVAVIGASERETSVGGTIFANLIGGGFQGKVHAVNPRRETVQGQPAFRTIEQVGQRIDLAIIATPAATVADLVEQCGRAGVRNVLIVATGFSDAGPRGATLEKKVLQLSRHAEMRLLGPNCIGLMRPALKLNACYSRVPVRAGDLALVSQSGSMLSAVLDWAASENVGFSSVISLGATADVDFGEILDYLIHDEQTRHILLFVEHIRNARRFMSALRSAARVKPIILLKAGRHDDDSDTADEVFEAATRRAGVVRAQNIDQLFHAAKALSSGFRPRGRHLAIVSNGHGPGTLAADRARQLGIPLATLTSETGNALGRLLPRNAVRDNLVDLGGQATPQQYREAIEVIARDPNVHSTLLVLAPHPATDPLDVAQAIAEVAAQIKPGLCCCWIGGGRVAEARRLLQAARVPVFHSPETAIELFHNIAKYVRNQKLLVQTPGPSNRPPASGRSSGRVLIETLLAERRHRLSVMESKAVLRAYRIPVAQTQVAHSATEALFIAEQIGLPVAMKIDSPDLAEKSAAGGVRLNIGSAESVLHAYHDIVQVVRQRHPEARIVGVSIEPHLNRPNGRELRVGLFRDPVFGPVIHFGAGGHRLALYRDRALGLPPLNNFLARDLIDATRIAEALDNFRHLPPVDRSALEKVLLGVSELACELPWVRELDINPLIADETGAIAADARIVIDHALDVGADRFAHLAIHPYPSHLMQTWQINGQTVSVRPIRPEDANLEQEFVRKLSDDARRCRFMDNSLKELPPSLLIRFTQIDYDREMALIATVPSATGEQQVGNARYTLTPDGETVEFAVAVADDWQKCGLGRRLMMALFDCARHYGYRTIAGDVLVDNPKMLRLMETLGFAVLPHPEDRSQKHVVKVLTP